MLFAAVAAQAQELSVSKQPPSVQYKTFDPRNPPKDMPKLSNSEAAVTHYEFGLSVRLSYQPLDAIREGDGFSAGIRVESIALRTTMGVVVWLPRDCPPALRAHEEGHRQLAEMFYKDAEAIARKAARPYVGRIITGHGNDPSAARTDATSKLTNGVIDAYMAQTKTPAERVNRYFDEITSHGASRKVNAVEGKQLALERYRREMATNGRE